ncbi:MAG: hypothetical protein IH905_17585 [Proteobacteria bacterium]|nr:hypothetical protein [Pseudomonadota bacterium]
MAEPTDIPGPLSDRSLAHGRNVMAAASVILVLAYVPDIEIKSFSPLGFDFNEGGELSVWGLLAAVLVYYAIRFGADCWTDYNGWIDTYREYVAVRVGQPPRDHAYNLHARRLNRKFWGLDVTPPALMFLAAMFAAYQQVGALWN